MAGTRELRGDWTPERGHHHNRGDTDGQRPIDGRTPAGGGAEGRKRERPRRGSPALRRANRDEGNSRVGERGAGGAEQPDPNRVAADAARRHHIAHEDARQVHEHGASERDRRAETQRIARHRSPVTTRPAMGGRARSRRAEHMRIRAPKLSSPGTPTRRNRSRSRPGVHDLSRRPFHGSGDVAGRVNVAGLRTPYRRARPTTIRRWIAGAGRCRSLSRR